MPDHRAVKSPRATVPETLDVASPGRRGVALAPPLYGIDVADAASVAGVALQFRHTDAQPAADRNTDRSGGAGGLPDRLRASIESLSGLDMGGVRVHYGSSEPARFGALAYTQGSEIHVAPGEERHLAHEAWHVVQQAQGRVAPTIQMKGGIAANHDPALEREADTMAAIAARLPTPERSARSARTLGQPVVQRMAGAPVRQFRCGGGGHHAGPSLPDIINKMGVTATPSTIANELSATSESFAELRGQADVAVKKTFERSEGVSYNAKPTTGSGTALAYYRLGDTYFDKNAPLPVTVLNVIFETANAAQAGKFRKIEDDYDKGLLADAPVSDYVDSVDALGKYHNDFHDAASKRSLIQEYYEWQSFELARATMLGMEDNFKSPLAQVAFMGFGELLKCRSFEEYYDAEVNGQKFARTHRQSVEESIRTSDKQKKTH